ncbi:MAG: glycoside hydrolase family 5 protein, partial [Bacteroidales bacterium]|nr:glycoside hydrolase family 5 protein [Bacteroidales bacterium]
MNNLSTFKNTLSFVFIIVLLSSCQPSKSPQSDKEDFVYVENKIFKIKQDTFFPMMLNYVIDFRDINNDLFVSASKNYENPDTYEYETKEESLKQLSIHFRLIKQLGFNTLRICMDRVDSDRKGNYFYKADNKKYFIKKEGRKITQALQECIDIAQDNDLKVMLLIKPPINNKDLENFTIQLLKKFYNQPTIFAYDFMNEPLYFDHEANRKKKDAVRIVNRWKELMSLHAPNQLLTIGFSEPIEVFEWDPSILAVDFVQVHTYHPLRVPNEIYWYSQYIDKAWMIGETALPADNDSISYEMQRQFIIDAFNYTVDCGGCGFGWWEFQEVKNTHFEAQYTGLLNHDSITLCDNYQLIGTLKPAAYEVASLKNHKKQK